MPRTRRLAACLALMSCCFSACSAQRGAWVEIGGERFDVQVADTHEERARGLMFVDAMDDDHGMVFVHAQTEPLGYWMKNTKIALDILYFDENRVLVGQQRDVPPCTAGDACPSYPSGAPARYVLELNAGQAARLGLEDGDRMTFGPAIPATPVE